MQAYIKQIFPKVLRYSNKLDKTSTFAEHPWLLFSDNLDSRKLYIFKQKDHKIIISVDGSIEYGKWDFLPEINSLIMEIGEDKKLFNQAFIDDSLMILKVDGKDDFMAFAIADKFSNNRKIKDYIESNYIPKNETAFQPNKINSNPKAEIIQLTHEKKINKELIFLTNEIKVFERILLSIVILNILLIPIGLFLFDLGKLSLLSITAFLFAIIFIFLFRISSYRKQCLELTNKLAKIKKEESKS
jgi:hypothetical protein